MTSARILALCAGVLASAGTWATAVRDIPDLVSISVFEKTGTVTEYTFAVDGPELSARLPDPLSSTNSDIAGGADTEYYDVYYSDANGGFDPAGAYVSVTGIYGKESPAGGALNLTGVALNYTSRPHEFGNFVASFVALGDNAVPETLGNAIDGDVSTHTAMGNTVGQSERLRITLGFASTGVPPSAVPLPGTVWLLGSVLFGLVGLKKNRCRPPQRDRCRGMQHRLLPYRPVP